MQVTNVERLPSFTPEARRLWAAVPGHVRPQLLCNVYCGTCRGSTTITHFSGGVRHKMLVLSGRCKRCGSEVARVVD